MWIHRSPDRSAGHAQTCRSNRRRTTERRRQRELAVRFLSVMPHVGPEHPLEVPAPVHDNVVQALGADGPHEPFGEGVGAGGTDRGPYPFIEGVALGGVDS